MARGTDPARVEAVLLNIKKNIPEVVKTPLKFLASTKARKGMLADARVRKLQDAAIARYPGEAKKLVVFLVAGPEKASGEEKISGGILSIVSLCEESARMKSIHGAEVIMCTLPGERLLFRHRLFQNETEVFRFAQLRKYFPEVEEIIFHLPEYTVEYFLDFLPVAERSWLRALPRFHANILNQNILLMPGAAVIARLQQLASLVTITTAHQRYCNAAYRGQYGVPLHKFSVWISPEKYAFKPYREKENLLVISPDNRPGKAEIVEALARIPGLRCQVIQNLTYEQYKEVIARAKWTLTFGEGLDGYLIEPVFSGAVGFAVYNENFFTPDFKTLDTIYPSLATLAAQIERDIARLDEEAAFTAYQRRQFDTCAVHYSQETYHGNIVAFYRGQYSFP